MKESRQGPDNLLLQKSFRDVEMDDDDDEEELDEKVFRLRKNRPAAPTGRNTAKCVIGVLAILNGILLALLWMSVRGSQKVANGNGPMSFIPHVSSETVEIREAYLFQQPASPESDAAWDSLVPGGRGVVAIDEPQRYGLPEGRPNKQGARNNVYGVTWTHQYHCLQMLRAEFWRLVRNESTLVGIEATANPEASRLPHLAHCFDYLRQTTMCNMDTTIEWPTGNLDEKGMKRINGYNITHICKKKEAIIDFMNEHLPE